MNLIYQYFIPYRGNDAKYNKGTIGLPDWARIGMNSAKQYAKNIGVEYMFTDQIHLNASLNVFESFRIFFDTAFDKYDNIFVLDVDTIVNTKENIFNNDIKDIALVHELGVSNRPPMPGVSFGPAFFNRYFNDPNKGVISYAKKHLDPNFKWKKSKMYPNEPFVLYNGGVQVWSKRGRIKARETFKRNGHDHFRGVTGKTETPYLNMMLFHHKFDITELSTDWNRLNFQWQADGNLGKITHYNDISKDGMLTHGK